MRSLLQRQYPQTEKLGETKNCVKSDHWEDSINSAGLG